MERNWKVIVYSSSVTSCSCLCTELCGGIVVVLPFCHNIYSQNSLGREATNDCHSSFLLCQTFWFCQEFFSFARTILHVLCTRSEGFFRQIVELSFVIPVCQAMFLQCIHILVVKHRGQHT